MCNSKAYQRSGKVDVAKKETDRARQPAQETQLSLFGRAPMRVMTADMLFESLKLAYGDPKLDLRTHNKDDGNTNGESAAVGDEYLEFHRKFGTNEDDATDFTHGIPQMLTFINHPRLSAGSKALEELLKKQPNMTPAQTVEWLYLATLSRRPTKEELAEAVEYVSKAGEGEKSDSKGAGGGVYKDVLWMLVNRSEFILVR